MSGILCNIVSNYNVSVPVTYATWNPADKYTGITLSNGNLTATHDGFAGIYETVRATIGKSSGKWYWENTITVGAGTATFVGVSNLSLIINNSVSQYLGLTVNGWGYFSANGQKVNNNSFAAYGATYVNGDVMGIALDMDAGNITIYKNNVSQGIMYTGLTGTLYPTQSLHSSSTRTVANFGATPLVYSPPVGFNAGIYS